MNIENRIVLDECQKGIEDMKNSVIDKAKLIIREEKSALINMYSDTIATFKLENDKNIASVITENIQTNTYYEKKFEILNNKHSEEIALIKHEQHKDTTMENMNCLNDIQLDLSCTHGNDLITLRKESLT